MVAEFPHKVWWCAYLRDRGGTSFWHETYFRRGGIESMYVDTGEPSASRASPVLQARGPDVLCPRPGRGGSGGSDLTVEGMPQGTIVPRDRAPRPIDPGVTIGHVHLRTADIDRVRAFYVDVLGFDVVIEARDVPGWGTTGDILFVAAGGYHHHLGFNTWKSAGGPPQPDGVAGLHHVALRYPTRAALADALRRLREATGRSARRPTTARTSPSNLRSRRQRPGAVLGPALRTVAARRRGPIAFAMDAPLDVEALLHDEGLLGPVTRR